MFSLRRRPQNIESVPVSDDDPSIAAAITIKMIVKKRQRSEVIQH